MKDNMNDNFSKLQARVFDSIGKTDLLAIRNILSTIKDPTLVSGVGGSSVVSLFLSKVLSAKNNIICEDVTPRDLNYKNLQGFKNIIVCSYGGLNYGVTTAFNHDLTKYLLARNTKDEIINLQYQNDDLEKSFISLAATLIPMTISLMYYLDNDPTIIYEILNSSPQFDFIDHDIYEILTGYETSTAARFMESTLVEAGLAIPILHDKYDYCHGRTTLGFQQDHGLLFFNNHNELDQLYSEILNHAYHNIITIDRKYDDHIINDYYFTYISMLLCKKIAEQKGKDLSNVSYSPLVKKLYFYKGEM